MSEVLDMLKQLNGNLANAPVTQNKDEFPDGNYVVKVEKADVVAVKAGENQGKPQVEWWLRVVAGPIGTTNRIIFHYHRLYGRDGDQVQRAIERFKTDLYRIGQEIASFDELPAILATLIASGQQLRISLKTGTAGIQNCYFNGLAT
jgi:hypothetical protein